MSAVRGGLGDDRGLARLRIFVAVAIGVAVGIAVAGPSPGLVYGDGGLSPLFGGVLAALIANDTVSTSSAIGAVTGALVALPAWQMYPTWFGFHAFDPAGGQNILMLSVLVVVFGAMVGGLGGYIGFVLRSSHDASTNTTETDREVREQARRTQQRRDRNRK